MPTISLTNLQTNKNDLHNYSTRNSANYHLALTQLKPQTMDYVLLDENTKHWNSAQNSLNLSFANNFVSSKTFLKAFKEKFPRIIQQSFDLFKDIQLTLWYTF